MLTSFFLFFGIIRNLLKKKKKRAQNGELSKELQMNIHMIQKSNDRENKKPPISVQQQNKTKGIGDSGFP